AADGAAPDASIGVAPRRWGSGGSGRDSRFGACILRPKRRNAMLADPTRRRILDLLAERGEATVC
ncbi:hypothetical protein ACSFB2_13140, partial [Glaesserella parasuis]|uniref:hypothetical protein n=1 Tax=Glaesserella parasuis TaxID=738 RepID=UPI003F3828D0